jgi:homoserine dehydrogenase
MPQLLRVLISAFVTAACLHLSAAAMAQPAAEPVAKQIPLTEKQVLGFIAAQKDLPPELKAALDAAAKKHGFKDFNDYDEVTANITLVMTGMDAKTKVFTDPAIAIKEEIQEVTANKALPAEERKQMLEELNEALQAAQPIQFPGNIELVKKHYDKIDAAVN